MTEEKETTKKDWKQRLQGLWKKENMLVLALVGVLLMVIAMPTGTKQEMADGESRPSAQTGKAAQTDGGEKGTGTELQAERQTESAAEALETRLEALLETMDGVGKTAVMVTLEGSETRIVEKDRPESAQQLSENDSAGGSRENVTRESEETTVYLSEADGSKAPYVKQRLEPKVLGVTVVAQGGGNPAVQKNISDVIQALFGVEAHKIKVVKMK